MRKHVLGVVLFVLFIVVVAPSALARTPDIGDISSPILRLRAEQSCQRPFDSPHFRSNFFPTPLFFADVSNR